MVEIVFRGKDSYTICYDKDWEFMLDQKNGRVVAINMKKKRLEYCYFEDIRWIRFK